VLAGEFVNKCPIFLPFTGEKVTPWALRMEKPQVWLMLGVPEWSFLESWNGVGDFLRPSL
jgi:hypothetical protein